METLLDGSPLDLTHVDTGDAGFDLRTQAQTDVARLTKLVPHDQCRTFRAVWDGPSLKFSLIVDARPEPEEAERIRLMSKTGEQLQVAAAKARVEWDKDASRETMVERIMQAPTVEVK